MTKLISMYDTDTINLINICDFDPIEPHGNRIPHTWMWCAAAPPPRCVWSPGRSSRRSSRRSAPPGRRPLGCVRAGTRYVAWSVQGARPRERHLNTAQTHWLPAKKLRYLLYIPHDIIIQLKCKRNYSRGQFSRTCEEAEVGVLDVIAGQVIYIIFISFRHEVGSGRLKVTLTTRNRM